MRVNHAHRRLGRSCAVPVHPGVLTYRRFRHRSPRRRTRLELPDCAVTVLIVTDGTLRVSPPVGPAATVGGGAVICGPHTSGGRAEHGGHISGALFRMAPWLACELLGTPISALTDRVVDASEYRDLRAPVTELPTTIHRRLRDLAPSTDPRLVRAWDLLVATDGRVAPAKLAAETGWSLRQLERHCGERLGMPPKRASRILRLRAALRGLETGSSPSSVAEEFGFYDQAHFGRVCRELTGYAPGRYAALRAGSGLAAATTGILLP